jgi:hypothetical protein
VEGWLAAGNEATGCGTGLSLGIDAEEATVPYALCLLCRLDLLHNYVVKSMLFNHPSSPRSIRPFM